ncbi:MAG: DUF4349 domain-containing protein [Jatrophihabitantaceae bacterium]
MPHRPPTSSRSVRWWALALATLALAGCGGAASKSSSSNAGSGAIAGLPAGDSAKLPAAAPAAAGGPAASQTPLQQRDIVRTATLDVTVGNVDRAAASALAATAAAGGRVDGDDRGGDRAGRHASLILRVPPAKLDGLIALVAKLGHENGRTVHGEDVTASRADTDAQVQALTISVGRLQDFLKHSGTITDLVALESQLTTRQSQLQSTIAQQRALADEIGLTTLTVSLSATAPKASAAGSDPSGFGTALVAALHGLLLVARWTGAILGYLLPFGLALAIVLVPAGLWWRQRRGAAGPASLPVEPVTE